MASVGARPGLGDAPAPPVVGGEWEAGVTRRPKLTQNARLLGLAVIVGAFGALGAQVFLWMLGLTEKYLLTWFTGWQLPTPDQVAGGGAIPSVHFLGWHLPLILVLGGLVSGALVYFFAPEAEGHGDDAAIKSYHQEGGRMRARVPVVKTIASAITIGSGGSAGREGPSAQIAAGFASVLGSLLKLSDDDRRYLVLMGMAAGLSAIFKSPLGTAIFAVEILYGSLAFEGTALGFTIVASAVAYGVTGAISGWAPLFHLPPHLAFDHASHLVAYAGLGLVAGLLASVAPTVFYGMRDLFHKIPIPPHFKPAIGGLLLGIPAMWLPQVLSGGYGWMQLAIDGRLPMMLMLGLALAKLISLALTMGSGGSGGVFAPTLYVGAMLGGGLAVVSHTVIGTAIPPQAFAVVGMAAVFAGAARVPLASLIMVAELTGSYGLVVPTMVAVVISVVVQQRLTRNARYQSLYESQVESPADSPVAPPRVLPGHPLAPAPAPLPPRGRRHRPRARRPSRQRRRRAAAGHRPLPLRLPGGGAVAGREAAGAQPRPPRGRGAGLGPPGPHHPRRPRRHDPRERRQGGGGRPGCVPRGPPGALRRPHRRQGRGDRRR